jgi:hypothetical protein
MQRRFGACALVLAITAFSATAVYAFRINPRPITQLPAPEQVAKSDAVVLGKVSSIADKTVKAKGIVPGQDGKVEYHVATVKVGDGFLGAKGLTDVQVAWVSNGNAPGGPRGFPPVIPQVNLTKDQEGCFFLLKHPTESFFVVVGPPDAVDKTSPEFEKYSNLVKKCAKSLDDPESGLKSKEASDRLLAASLLLTHYRQPKLSGSKQVEIDADESKLILQAMAEADFTKTDTETGASALNMFYQLGLTPKDGWKIPQKVNQTQLFDAMKKWLKDNADTYRIKKVV